MGPGVSDALWLSFYPASYVAIVLMVRARLPGRARGCGSTGSSPPSPPAASPPSSCSSRSSARARSRLADPHRASPIRSATCCCSRGGHRRVRPHRLAARALVDRPRRRRHRRRGRRRPLPLPGDARLLRRRLGAIDALWPASTLLLGWGGVGCAWTGAGRPTRPRCACCSCPPWSTLTGLAVLVAGNLGGSQRPRRRPRHRHLLAAIVRLALTLRREPAPGGRADDEALTDALTGLGNRRRLMRDLERRARVATPGSRDARAVRPRRLQALQRHLRAPRRRRAARPLGAQPRAAVDATAAPTASAATSSASCSTGVDDDGRARCWPRRVAALARARRAASRSAASCGAVALPAEADTPPRALKLADQRLYAREGDAAAHAVSQPDPRRAAAGAARARARPARPRRRASPSSALAVGARARARPPSELDEVAPRRRAARRRQGRRARRDPRTSPARSTSASGSFMRQHTIVGDRILRAAPALASRRRARAREPRALRRHAATPTGSPATRSRSARASSPSATPSTR